MRKGIAVRVKLIEPGGDNKKNAQDQENSLGKKRGKKHNLPSKGVRLLRNRYTNLRGQKGFLADDTATERENCFRLGGLRRKKGGSCENLQELKRLIRWREPDRGHRNVLLMGWEDRFMFRE